MGADVHDGPRPGLHSLDQERTASRRRTGGRRSAARGRREGGAPACRREDRTPQARAERRWHDASSTDALVVFMPSGRRGRFAIGTPLLQAARSLGVDVDSVCGGRGICGRCQVEVAEGEFAKHGVTSSGRASLAASAPSSSATPTRARPAGRPAPLLLGPASYGDVVIDVPPDSQVHRQVVRKAAEARGDRARSGRAPALCRGRRAGHARSGRRPAAPAEGAARANGS